MDAQMGSPQSFSRLTACILLGHHRANEHPQRECLVVVMKHCYARSSFGTPTILVPRCLPCCYEPHHSQSQVQESQGQKAWPAVRPDCLCLSSISLNQSSRAWKACRFDRVTRIWTWFSLPSSVGSRLLDFLIFWEKHKVTQVWSMQNWKGLGCFPCLVDGISP